MKRTAAPGGLLEFPASGRKEDISAQHTAHAHALFLSVASINLARGRYHQRTVDSVVFGRADVRIGPAGAKVVASPEPDLCDLSELLQQKHAS